MNETDAKLLARVKPATFMCFDVLEYEGENIEGRTYEERKEVLARVDGLRVPHFEGVFPIGVGGQEQSVEERHRAIKGAWEAILGSDDEGMVAKRVGSRYSHCRSPDWIKLKTWREEDFDVVGFMAPVVVVIRKSDKAKGSMFFTHSPRFYYGFEVHKP